MSNVEFTSTDNTPLNLIVFFVEGMSARIIQPYSDLFPSISPNIEDFSYHSTTIRDYYNHTFATYRGLGGQLCSIFPIGKLLKRTDYYCLPHALSERNYDTHFLFSQKKQKTHLFNVIKKTGFSKIDTYDEIKVLTKDKDNGLYNSDKSLIKALNSRLDEYARAESPFFIGLYNIETHNGFKIGQDGSRYRSPDNKVEHEILDTFYNFDVAFGKFWQYFKQSKLFDNTIVVLTSDHAKFPSDEYVKLVSHSPGWGAKFSDQIPFIIYHPHLEKGVNISVDNASSIDFTPSILHLMKLSPGKATFLGQSIFDKDRNSKVPVLSGTASIYMYHLTVPNKWNTITPKSVGSLPEKFARVKSKFRHIQFQQALERANLLTPKDGS